MEEATTGTRSLCEAGKRYFEKGPVPVVLNVFRNSIQCFSVTNITSALVLSCIILY